ncbi:MAG: hypothetical protein EP319_07425 [Deltaproteobacteria bacterium]|nr:MAG: hypothetical protein EP319_07425 [Deltaproteobacteria bacterium]
MKKQLTTALALMALAPSVMATPSLTYPYPGKVVTPADSQDRYLSFRTTGLGRDEEPGVISKDNIYVIPESKMTITADMNMMSRDWSQRCSEYDQRYEGLTKRRVSFETRLDEVSFQIEELELEGVAEDDQRMISLRKREEMYEKRLAKIEADKDALRYAAGIQLDGVWDSGFAEAVQRFRAANPHLSHVTTNKVQSQLDQIMFSADQSTKEKAMFYSMKIDNEIFDAGASNYQSFIPGRAKLSLDEQYMKDLIAEKDYSKINLFQSLKGKTNAFSNVSSDNGLFSGILTQEATCMMIRKMQAGDDGVTADMKMVVHSMIPVAANLDVEAKYSMYELYQYIKNEKEGIDGINILKRKKVQKIREKLHKRAKFIFKYNCSDVTGSICRDEMEVKKLAADFLLNQALTMFTQELPPNFDKDKLKVENNLDEAAGSVATAIYGPAVGRAVKAVASVLSSTETEQDIEREMKTEVSEEWTITKTVWVPSSRSVVIKFK